MCVHFFKTYLLGTPSYCYSYDCCCYYLLIPYRCSCTGQLRAPSCGTGRRLTALQSSVSPAARRWQDYVQRSWGAMWSVAPGWFSKRSLQLASDSRSATEQPFEQLRPASSGTIGCLGLGFNLLGRSAQPLKLLKPCKEPESDLGFRGLECSDSRAWQTRRGLSMENKSDAKS